MCIALLDNQYDTKTNQEVLAIGVAFQFQHSSDPFSHNF